MDLDSYSIGQWRGTSFRRLATDVGIPSGRRAMGRGPATGTGRGRGHGGLGGSTLGLWFYRYYR